MNRDNLRLTIVSKTLKGLCDSTDPWHGSQFSKTAIQFPEKEYPVGRDSLPLQLPTPNPFIPSPADLEWQAFDTNAAEEPQMILHSDQFLFFHDEVAEFKQPKLKFGVKIYSPFAVQTVEHSVHNSIFCSCVKELLNEVTYSSELAGLYHSLYPTSTGLVLKIYGFSSKASVLLETVLEQMISFESIESNKLRAVALLVVERKIKSWKNYLEKSKPYVLAGNCKQETIFSNDFSLQEELRYLQQFKENSVQNPDETLLLLRLFLKGVLVDYCAEGLICGFISKPSANNLIEKVKTALEGQVSSSSFSSKTAVLSRVMGKDIQLLAGTKTALVAVHPDPEKEDNALRYCLQVQLKNISERMCLSILQKAINASFSIELRTKKQLGYVVNSGMSLSSVPLADDFRVASSGFLDFNVQSKYPLPEVEAHIVDFIENILLSQNEISEEKFKDLKKSLVNNFSVKSRSVIEKFDYYWGKISNRTYIFNSREEMKQAASKLTLTEFQNFVSSLSFATLAVHLKTMKHAEYALNNCIEIVDVQDAEALRQFKSKQTWSRQQCQVSVHNNSRI
eukprot:maker-scaffold_14-snap-gene-10.22-mRNA-1 protein AED:0.70 eAED:0.73 QI:0/0/0/1/1/1/2/0/564